MFRPVLFVVDSDEDSLRAIERELVDRYERSYRIVCLGSAAEAEAELVRMSAAGEDVDGRPRWARCVNVRDLFGLFASCTGRS